MYIFKVIINSWVDHFELELELEYGICYGSIVFQVKLIHRHPYIALIPWLDIHTYVYLHINIWSFIDSLPHSFYINIYTNKCQCINIYTNPITY